MSAAPPTVAALFVEPGGVYADLEGVELWDETRDARLYPGPWPVVAHPPCARWCNLAGLVEHRHGYKKGDDGGCFASALNAVQAYGGVLEHPAYSRAWDAYGLPEPLWTGGWTGGLDGGWSCYLEQRFYGHPGRKATWLYACGVELPELRWGVTRDASGLAIVSWANYGRLADNTRRRLPSSEASRTPLPFRDALLAIARSASREPAAVAT